MSGSRRCLSRRWTCRGLACRTPPTWSCWSSMKSLRTQRRTRWRRRKCWRCSASPSVASSTLASVPDALYGHCLAGRCERGWSCTFAHGEEEFHPHALREAHRGRASAAHHHRVHESPPQILGNSWQVCRLHHRSVCRRVCPFSRETCCGDPVHSARAHCRTSPVPQIPDQILEAAKSIPQERVLHLHRGPGCSIQAPQIMPNNVEEIQLVLIAVEQVVAIPMGKS